MVWDSRVQPEKVDNGLLLRDQANQLHLDGKLEEAEKIYTDLLQQNYNNNGLMATLGSLYGQQKKWGLCIHFLQSAVDAGLGEHDAFTNLAFAYHRTGQLEKAHEYYEKSIDGGSGAEALVNYSGMFLEADPQKCRELCERAIKEKPDLPVAHWNLALTLLAEGQWHRGWDEHDWGLKPGCMRTDRAVLDVPWWDGTPGKTVHVYGEQGLGDEIMFASMLPDLLKTNKVILECHPRLVNLFKRSFDIPVYGTRENSEVDWAHDQPMDYRIAIGSLGRFFRRTAKSFPGTSYLKADPLPRGEKFRVGFSWKGGGAKLSRVQTRSIPLSWWKPLFSIPNIEFVSLQYGIGREEVDVMQALGYDIQRMDEYANADDYYETARLVKSCDLVISICTSVIHLAGSLGVPTWCLTPRFPAWRYQTHGPIPWYRSVRLYRQPYAGQDGWEPVIERVRYDLSELMERAA